MNAMLEYSKEAEINLMKIEQFSESAFDQLIIKTMELGANRVVNSYITESECEIISEATISEFAKKVVTAIEKIIGTIKEYIKKMADKVKSLITKDEKDALDKVKDHVNKNNITEKVDMYDEEANKKMLDEYIQKMVKLERKLMICKVDSKMRDKTSHRNFVEITIILHEMDKLEQEYDRKFLNDNADLISMAAKDAIRFNEKQLNNVKVNYDAVEKGSEQVLAVFKKDAEGCDVPEKLNVIQNMSNRIATRVRQYTLKMSTQRHHNLKTVLTLGTLSMAGKFAVDVYKYNPEVKKQVDDAAAKVMDKLNAYNDAAAKARAQA